MGGYLIVFIGAGLGGALRHAVNSVALRLAGPPFPAATMAVNIVGSVVMGLLVGWFAHRSDPGQSWRLFLTTGMLGGFTTFSTFSLDTILLWERGQALTAIFYVVLSIALSIIGLLAGMIVVRQFS